MRLSPQEGSLLIGGRDMQRKSGQQPGETIASTCRRNGQPPSLVRLPSLLRQGPYSGIDCTMALSAAPLRRSLNPPGGAAHEKGARSGDQAPLLGLLSRREGNPALCRWPRGLEEKCGHSAGTAYRQSASTCGCAKSPQFLKGQDAPGHDGGAKRSLAGCPTRLYSGG
jgi:hypothetical protein